jgi:TetR/AcrR family transcriptional regulator, transcriptional repressor for nem operon
LTDRSRYANMFHMARHKEFDQTKVKNKAKELFWLQGYEATSIQDLVDYLGINRSSLYDTFDNKLSLFLTALDIYQEDKYAELLAVFNDYGFSKSTIELVFRALVEEAVNDKLHRGCFTANSTVELAHQNSIVAQKCIATREKMEKLYYKALLNAQEEGQLNTRQSLQALARFLYNSAQSIQIIAKTQPERDVLEDIVKVTLSVLE